MKRNKHRAVTTAKIAALCALVMLAGCSGKTAAAAEGETAAGRPSLQVEAAQDYLTIRPSELNGQYDGNICYDGVSNVCIVLDGKSMPLEEAVKEGKVTVEELIACAQEDARTGACTQGQCTYNGLTKFTYTYPEYMLIAVHDVYETPDGNQYIINEFTVTTPKELKPAPIGYSDAATGEYLDLEDWGIAFTPTRATSEGVMLTTDQEKGQNFGDLYLTDFYLVSEPEKEFLGDSQVYGLSIPIKMNGSGEVELTWNSAMPAGDYTLVVRLEEKYNKEDMPALMRNYHDAQQYLIPITIQ